MSIKRCHYGDCKNSSKCDGILFYRFPNPNKQPIKFRQWMQCSGWDLAETFRFDYSRSPRYVCSKHFLEDHGPTKLNPNPVELNGKIAIWNVHCRKVITNVDNADYSVRNECQPIMTGNLDATINVVPEVPIQNDSFTMVPQIVSQDLLYSMITENSDSSRLGCMIYTQEMSEGKENQVYTSTPYRNVVLEAGSSKETEKNKRRLLYEEFDHNLTVSPIKKKRKPYVNLANDPNKIIEYLDMEEYELLDVSGVINTTAEQRRFEPNIANKHPSPTKNEFLISPTCIMDCSLEKEVSCNTRHSQEKITSRPKLTHIRPRMDQYSTIQSQISAQQNNISNVSLNISSLHIALGCPLNWTTCYGENLAKYSIAKEDSLLLSYSVHSDMTTSLRVMGKEMVSSHFVMEKLPTNIDDASDVLKALDQLQKFTVCSGNAKSEFGTNEVKSHIGFHCPITNALHSVNCTLLIKKDGRIKRCKNCQRYRTFLRKQKLRAQQPKKKITALPRHLLLSTVRKRGRRSKYFANKCKALRKKYNAVIREKGHEMSKDDNRIFRELLQDNMGEQKDFHKFFLQQQLSASRVRHSRARRWHPDIIKWCLMVHSKNPGAYELLRKTGALFLPCSKTLYNYAKPLTAEPGFHPESFALLKEEMENLGCYDEDHSKFNMFLLDEISVKEELVYKRSTGDLIGFVDLGESINELRFLDKRPDDKKIELATHILQIMVKGIASKLQFSLAFFPCHKLNADQLELIVWEGIEKCEVMDCRILLIVGDGASTNRSFFKRNMVQPENGTISHFGINYFALEENPRPLFFVFDNPHAMKTARNNIYSSTFAEKKPMNLQKKQARPKRLLRRKGKHILWDHIRTVYYNDVERMPRLYPKLKFSHIKLTNRSKMRVKYAVQVLSKTGAVAVENEVGDDGSETVELLKLLDKYFDIMNVSNFTTGYCKRNSDLRPFLSAEDERLMWLENDFLQYFQEWEKEVAALSGFTAAQRKMMLLSPETSEALKISALSVVNIVRYMLSKGAKYILTRKINQDPLEQEFGKHRSLCGSNTNPTVCQYGQNVGKIRLIKGMVPDTVGGNTTVLKEKL